jgi:hypothetical protein
MLVQNNGFRRRATRRCNHQSELSVSAVRFDQLLSHKSAVEFTEVNEGHEGRGNWKSAKVLSPFTLG